MKKFVWIGILFLAACGGKVSDEHRKKMLESMQENKIVKITEAEILATALQEGKQILQDLQKGNPSSEHIDSIADHYSIKVKFLVPGDETASELEQQLIEAYVMGAVTGEQDNIQPLTSTTGSGYDTLLYAAPSIKKLANGIDSLAGIWNVYIPKKNVVKQITKSRK